MGTKTPREIPDVAATAIPMEEVVTKDTFHEASHRVNSDVTVKNMKRKALGSVYDAEPKVSIMVAPMYEAHFGKIMNVSINGINCAVPCDGKPYTIPETFAAEVQARLRAVNEQQAKQKRFSEIGRNNETSPGELKLY